MKIIKNEVMIEKFSRFDLSIDGTHNFLCNGIVVHNTSTHIAWKYEEKSIRFASGGESNVKFRELFDEESLKAKFEEHFPDINVIVYGEGYGGKQQGMSHMYGKELKFIAFDVKIGEYWIDVPNAEDVSNKLGFEFIHYDKVLTEIEKLDALKDAPSVQSVRNGITEPKQREGIVLRPLKEMKLNNGARVIVKYKPDENNETKSKREVSPEALKVLEDAKEIAEEWVVPMRLTHVLQKFPEDVGMESMGDIIKAMIEDVNREAEGEIVKSKEVNKSIGIVTVILFKRRLESTLYGKE